jgi:hypothetical protein
VSDKPSQKSLSSSFRSTAMALLVGSIALYLAVRLLESIALPLAVLTSVVLGVVILVVWLRRSGGSQGGW